MTAKQVLGDCQVFSTLGNAELGKVAALTLEKQYEAGTTLFREGDSADYLFILEEGKVALQLTLPGEVVQMSRKITVDVVSGNEVVGWSPVVEPYVYTLTAICLQKVKALSISGSKLRWLIRDNPKIGLEVLNGLIKVVASRLSETRRVLASERLLTPKPE